MLLWTELIKKKSQKQIDPEEEKRKKILKSLGRNAKMHNLGIECIFQQKSNAELTHISGKKKIAILVQQIKKTTFSKKKKKKKIKKTKLLVPN